MDFKRASFASQLGVNCKLKEHVLDLKCAKKCDKIKKGEGEGEGEVAPPPYPSPKGRGVDSGIPQ